MATKDTGRPTADAVMKKLEQGSTEAPAALRTTREYEEGRQARLADVAENAGPYVKGNDYHAWITGWLDEDTKARLGHVFDKHGITWP